jgi:thymidine kinase
MDTRFIDYRYICGRDNYTCVYCGTETSPPTTCVSQIKPNNDWNPSNVIVTCDVDSCSNFKLAQSRQPNLPSDQITGRLIAISGPMFGSKTTFTQSLLNKYRKTLGEFLWVKPDRDDRGVGITTHNEEEFSAHIISWQRPDRHLKELEGYPIVAFDEVQFYSERILFVVHQLLKKGVLVIVNGLKLDFQRNYFGVMHYLLNEADDNFPLKAVCNGCGMIDVATRTKKRSADGPSVETGGADKYYAICPNCEKEQITNLKF